MALSITTPGVRYAKYPPDTPGRKTLNFPINWDKRMRKSSGVRRFVASSAGFLPSFVRCLSRRDSTS
jgi:hypothetical protein